MSLQNLGALRSFMPSATITVCLAAAILPGLGGCPQGGTDLTECANRLDLFDQAANAAIEASQTCGAGDPCPNFCTKLKEMNDLLQQLQEGGCFTGTAGQPELGAQLQAQVDQLTEMSGGICP